MSKSRAIAAEIIAGLMKSNQTCLEVADMADCHPRTAQAWIDSLRASGLVRKVKPPEGSRATYWEWQKSPFALEDFAS